MAGHRELRLKQREIACWGVGMESPVTVATGETLDLSSFYVVMTSNIGSAELMSLQHSSDATLERHVFTRAQQTLRPEIFARITEKLVFHRLSYEHQLVRYLLGHIETPKIPEFCVNRFHPQHAPTRFDAYTVHASKWPPPAIPE